MGVERMRATGQGPGASLSRRAVLALLASLAACSDPDASYRNRVDTGWHRDDLEALLLRWHSHAPRPDGSFHLRFDRGWRPQPQPELSLAGQAHLVYAFAAGHEFIQDAGYLTIAKRAASFMLTRFSDEAHGGFFHSLGPDGRPLGLGKRADDHAFVLLALAEVYRMSGDSRFRDAAQQAWQDIERGFNDPEGGFYAECERDFTPLPGARTQAPVLHMFEALLALRSASGDKQAEAGVRRLGDFAAAKLLQTQPDGGAFIAEWYDEAWKALPTREAGGYVDIGHQFAWSCALAAGAVVSPAYGKAAERLMSYAMGTGYDEAQGGCGTRAFPDDPRPDARKGWWQQAECLQALIVAAQSSGRTDLWKRYEQTERFVKAQLVDNEFGGWRLAEALPCSTGGCRDEQPDPYHMVRLHQAALKAAS